MVIVFSDFCVVSIVEMRRNWFAKVDNFVNPSDISAAFVGIFLQIH